ncbi:putative zinc finger, CCHC-type containing protein [Tanacetum coccineum]
MPLNDPSLLTALKAQIQIAGTPQVNTFQSTFHYQMAYRVQNYSLDILVPGQDNAGDALVDKNADGRITVDGVREVPNHCHICCALNHSELFLKSIFLDIQMKQTVSSYDHISLAAETEVTEPRLSAVLINFESQYRQGFLFQRIQSPTARFSIRIDDKQQRKPVWAIGTDKATPPEQAQEVHVAVRGWLAKKIYRLSQRIECYKCALIFATLCYKNMGYDFMNK